jgi:hypothetical protein
MSQQTRSQTHVASHNAILLPKQQKEAGDTTGIDFLFIYSLRDDSPFKASLGVLVSFFIWISLSLFVVVALLLVSVALRNQRGPGSVDITEISFMLMVMAAH